MEDYEDHVQTLFDLDSDRIFSNGMEEHALVILSEFFKRAEASVLIFCKNLLSNVYDHKKVTSALVSALRRGVDVKVIVQEGAEAVKFIELAKKYNLDPEISGVIQIFECTDQKISKVRQNIAIMDKKAFRYEEDKDEPKALASANQPKIANSLSQDFMGFWSILERLQCKCIVNV